MAKEYEEKEAKVEDAEAFDSEAYESSKDKLWTRFQRRVSRAPSQIIRYDYGGEPLRSAEGLEPNPGVCGVCGTLRVFEMQVMPSVLADLVPAAGIATTEIEWTTLDVYVCPNSECAVGKVVQEHAFVQPAF